MLVHFPSSLAKFHILHHKMIISSQCQPTQWLTQMESVMSSVKALLSIRRCLFTCSGCAEWIIWTSLVRHIKTSCLTDTAADTEHWSCALDGNAFCAVCSSKSTVAGLITFSAFSCQLQHYKLYCWKPQNYQLRNHTTRLWMLSYTSRLAKLKLDSLEVRRLKQDLVLTYKIILCLQMSVQVTFLNLLTRITAPEDICTNSPSITVALTCTKTSSEKR